MNGIRNRIEIAHLHGGGIFMTTLILVAGWATPRVLKGVARFLEHFLRRMDA
jgi:hypothetical protein